jgi:hypothetical protein
VTIRYNLALACRSVAAPGWRRLLYLHSSKLRLPSLFESTSAKKRSSFARDTVMPEPEKACASSSLSNRPS